MATYYCQMQTIGRASGRSAIAAAAYRASEKIKDFINNKVADFRRKQGTLYSNIVLPKHLQSVQITRQKLWNLVELAEKRKNSVVAREFVVGLPHETDVEGMKKITQEFAEKLANDNGWVVDYSIHKPNRKGDERNYHAHIMVTTRTAELDVNNELFFTKKTRAWDNKYTGSKKLEAVRKDWENIVNRELERINSNERVSCETLEKQGIDREPQKKQGVEATNEYRKTGKMSDEIAHNIRLKEIAILQREVEILNRKNQLIKNFNFNIRMEIASMEMINQLEKQHIEQMELLRKQQEEQIKAFETAQARQTQKEMDKLAINHDNKIQDLKAEQQLRANNRSSFKGKEDVPTLEKALQEATKKALILLAKLSDRFLKTNLTEKAKQIDFNRVEILKEKEEEKQRYYLEAEYKDSQMLKNLGAEYDRERREFYITDDHNKEDFEQWKPRTLEERREQTLQDLERQKQAEKQAEQEQSDEQRYYLDSKFEDRDKLKNLGAEYDKDRKEFYITNDHNKEDFEHFNPRTLEERRVQTLLELAEQKQVEKQAEQQQPVDEQRYYLSAKYEERELIKNLGASYDKENKEWYITDKQNKEDFEQWQPLTLEERKELALQEVRQRQQEQINKQSAEEKRYYLTASYEDRDIVKNLGAKFDKENKEWYVTDKHNKADFEYFNPQTLEERREQALQELKQRQQQQTQQQTIPNDYANFDADFEARHNQLRENSFAQNFAKSQEFEQNSPHQNKRENSFAKAFEKEQERIANRGNEPQNQRENSFAKAFEKEQREKGVDFSKQVEVQKHQRELQKQKEQSFTYSR